MPFRAALALIALCIALGAYTLGEVVIVPMVASPGPLADANLADALSRPLALRLSEFALIGSMLLWAACARGWGRGALSTLSGAALALSCLDRAYLLPRLHEAAASVDLVTQSPASNMATLARAELTHQLVVATNCVLLLAVALIFARTLEQARVRAASLRAQLDAQTSANPPTEATGSAPAPDGWPQPA